MRSLLVALALVVLAAACRKGETREPGVDASAASMPTFVVDAAPARTTLIGFELVQMDDGFGRADATELHLVVREPERRELVDFGVRGGCRDVEPARVPTAPDGTGPRVLSAIAIACERPAPATIHVVVERDALVLVKTPHERHSKPAPLEALEDVAREPLPHDSLGAIRRGPLQVVTSAPPPATTAVRVASLDASADAFSVVVEWRAGGLVHPLEVERHMVLANPGTSGAERKLVLSLRGALHRDVSFGPLGFCNSVAKADRSPLFHAPNARSVLHCYMTHYGNTDLSLVPSAEGLRVFVARSEEGGATIERLHAVKTLALPRGVSVAPIPEASIAP